MLELGKVQKLVIVKRVEFGAYLAPLGSDDPDDKVLLPLKQVPPYSALGDEVTVFLYKDSKDRIIATTKTPLLSIGEVAYLPVVEIGNIGAFINWGLEKDLLLPFKQQTTQLRVGQSYLVSLYVDKSERLCATMDVYKYLSTDSPYSKDDKVTGTVYEISQEFGAYVAVDNKYSAMIPKKEMYGSVTLGQVLEARVTDVKPDGKLDLSIREKSYLLIETDAEKIMEMLNINSGVIPFTDKADPETIKQETGMSKNEFKRAIGNLLKNKKIEITDKDIRLI